MSEFNQGKSQEEIDAISADVEGWEDAEKKDLEELETNTDEKNLEIAEEESPMQKLKEISEQISNLKHQENGILRELEEQGKTIELMPLYNGGLSREKLDDLGVYYELDDEGNIDDEDGDLKDKIVERLKINGFQLYKNYTSEGWLGEFSMWIKE